MKTDKQTQIVILRRVIENIESERKAMDGIQFFGSNGEWEDKAIFELHFNLFSYRIKPKTITLANGVVIPEPLNVDNLIYEERYFSPRNDSNLFASNGTTYIKDSGTMFIYATKEEAIEASKALFGID